MGDLSERQHSGARLVSPVETDDGALVEFRFASRAGFRAPRAKNSCGNSKMAFAESGGSSPWANRSNGSVSSSRSGYRTSPRGLGARLAHFGGSALHGPVHYKVDFQGPEGFPSMGRIFGDDWACEVGANDLYFVFPQRRRQSPQHC